MPVANLRRGGSIPPLVPTGPDRFAVRDWEIFGPGFHKGEMYTSDELQKASRNFSRLSQGPNPKLRVKAKLGHDSEQRAARSIGLGSLGDMTRCDYDPVTRSLILNIENIPRWAMVRNGDFDPSINIGPENPEYHQIDLKKRFDDGEYNDGSIELNFNFPDPDDQSRQIDGPVVEGVAFLGEEQPAVKGFSRPIATFSAPLPRRGRRRVRFSELTPLEGDPMSRDEMIAKLCADKGLEAADLADSSDDDLRAMLAGGTEMFAKHAKVFAKLAGGKFSAEPGAPMPASTAAPKPMMSDTGTTDETAEMAAKKKMSEEKPEQPGEPLAMEQANGIFSDLSPQDPEYMSKCMARMTDHFTKKMGAMQKELGGTQAAVQDMKPKVEMSAQMSAKVKSAEDEANRKLVENVVNEAIRTGRVAPALARQMDLVGTGLGVLQGTRKTFSATGTTQTFSQWSEELMALPINPNFRPTSVEQAKVGSTPGIKGNPLAVAILSPNGRLARERPKTAERLRELVK